MSAPEQFYCDQETDGGGCHDYRGRARAGLRTISNGRARCRQPHQNPLVLTRCSCRAESVNALLNGTRPQIRWCAFHRAMNVNGTAWQDFCYTRAASTEWSWTLCSTMHWSNIWITIRATVPWLQLLQPGEDGGQYLPLRLFDDLFPALWRSRHRLL